jgi:enoyl-CoA hydratase/carnithine racemase
MTTTATTTESITTELEGHVWLIGLNRAAKRNAFDMGMLEGLANALSEADRRPEVRCSVIFAHGDHFTGGLDLANVAPQVASGRGFFPEGAVDPWGVHGPVRQKPLVMAVKGRCLTLGIELILAADVTIAADDTTFAQIEIKRGIFPFGGATLRMHERVGWGNAMRWLLTGDEFGAAEAHRIGLVQEVVKKGDELARAITIAETIARQAPLGVLATLRSARTAASHGPDAAAKELMPQIIQLMGTDDAREGMMSFIERREGKFSGK